MIGVRAGEGVGDGDGDIEECGESRGIAEVVSVGTSPSSERIAARRAAYCVAKSVITMEGVSGDHTIRTLGSTENEKGRTQFKKYRITRMIVIERKPREFLTTQRTERTMVQAPKETFRAKCLFVPASKVIEPIIDGHANDVE